MPLNQTIRYATTRDQVRLAWATSGAGPTLVKAANWITHLEYDWESPVWRHWMAFLSSHFRLIRYDERGCGLSQRELDDVSSRNWVNDLEDIVAVARPKVPFVLLGISQGSCACVDYAVRHPEHVSHLVLYGGYAEGWAMREDQDHVRERRALAELMGLGWGRPDPLYRRLFTKRFLPEGGEELLGWFDELCSRTINPGMAWRLFQSRGQADVRKRLGQVRVPTLVVHADRDEVAPVGQGQMLAAGIPGAEFVQLESCNHILLEQEPAWQRFQDVVLEFTGVGRRRESEALSALSERERGILGKLLEGHTNAEIGRALFISETTVRNQLTRIFEKLGVRSRAQAIVMARDSGFQSPALRRQN